VRGQRRSSIDEKTCILGPRASTNLPHSGPTSRKHQRAFDPSCLHKRTAEVVARIASETDEVKLSMVETYESISVLNICGYSEHTKFLSQLRSISLGKVSGGRTRVKSGRT
jgi:hypothetical protein